MLLPIGCGAGFYYQDYWLRVFFFSLAWWAWAQVGVWLESIFALLPQKNTDQWYWFYFFMELLLKGMVVLLLVKLYKLIVLAFASPILLLLSGKVLQHLENSVPPNLSWWG